MSRTLWILTLLKEDENKIMYKNITNVYQKKINLLREITEKLKKIIIQIENETKRM